MTLEELLELHKQHATNKSPTLEEILLFYSAIHVGKVQTVLECGTYYGMSAMWAASALNDNDAEGKVYTFDGLEREFLFKGTELEDKILFTQGAFEERIGEVVALNPPRPWFVFIDGAWRYKPNKAYFDAIQPHLEDGDYVMWHDSTDGLSGRGLHSNEQGSILFRGVNGIAIYQHGISKKRDIVKGEV